MVLSSFVKKIIFYSTVSVIVLYQYIMAYIKIANHIGSFNVSKIYSVNLNDITSLGRLEQAIFILGSTVLLLALIFGSIFFIIILFDWLNQDTQITKPDNDRMKKLKLIKKW